MKSRLAALVGTAAVSALLVGTAGTPSQAAAPAASVKAAARYTPVVTFAPPVSVGKSSVAPASVIAYPARPGAIVNLFVQRGSRFVLYKRTRQNSGGIANFYGVPTGSASAPVVYKAQTFGGSYLRTSAAARSVVLSHKVFGDEFSSRTLNPQWKYRTQTYNPRRQCSTSGDRGTIGLNGSVATFRVVKKTSGVPAACRKSGAYSTPMITSGTLSQPYGYYTARIKFQHDRGMHSAFWLQGGSEIDTAEFFGYHRPISNLLHNGSVNTGNVSVGGDRPSSAAILGRYARPYNSYHTYSVQWSPAGYVFRMDNVPTLVTTQKKTDVPAEIILSQQISDWEMPYLNPRLTSSVSSEMQVDYVRAYQ